jgi:hypothetical protein
MMSNVNRSNHFDLLVLADRLLRSTAEAAKLMEDTGYTGTGTTNSTDEQRDTGITDISEITIWKEQSDDDDDDNSIRVLGEALLIQLQNVLSLDEQQQWWSLYCRKNHQYMMDVPVVHHLEICVPHSNAHWNHYQPIFQYVANHRTNPFLESISIVSNCSLVYFRNELDLAPRNHFVYTLLDALILQQQYQSQQWSHGKIGLQKLSIYDCIFANVPRFASFIRQMNIPILDINCLSFVEEDDVNHEMRIVDNTHGALDTIADAFRDNTTIQELFLEVDTDTLPSVSAVINQLRYNTTLQRLRLEWSIFDFETMMDNIGIIAEPGVQEFVQILAQYLTETRTLKHIELMDFEFIEPNILSSILTAISSNPSIQIVTLLKCRFDEYNWKHVLKTQFQHLIHVRRLEINLVIPADDAIKEQRMKYYIYEILPSNLFIQQLCVLPERLNDGITSVIDDNDKSFLLSYLRRNRGLQQFIRQYAKGMMLTITAGTTSSSRKDDENDDGSVKHHSTMGSHNHDSFNHIHELLQTTLEKQRRHDHQYCNARRYQQQQQQQRSVKQENYLTTGMKSCSDIPNNMRCSKSNIGPNNNNSNNTEIPIVLIPMILSNHISTSHHPQYGRTIIYQMFSSMNFHYHHHPSWIKDER